MKKIITALAIFSFLFGCDVKTEPSEVTIESGEVTDGSLKHTKEKTFPELKEGRYNVGILLIDEVFNTEFTAPYDVFQHTGGSREEEHGIKGMNVFTVSNRSDFVKSYEGTRYIPDYNFLEDSLPRIDILVIPSGNNNLDVDLENKELMDFVKVTSDKAEYVTSHCDGAFLLAKSGAISGYELTTYPGDIESMREMFPELTVHDDVTFVHHDKFITSVGGAKSFDAALYLCEHLYGKEIAEGLARPMVIDWNLDQVPFVKVEK